MFVVKWTYLGQADFALFGPFKTYEAAEAWMYDRSGVIGDGEVHQVSEALTSPRGLRGISRRDEQKIADRIDGYDADDLGESPDY